mmetsp:Transcript_47434/g.140116  ORF Transcript_47434/g.140116 Transcript_47434/m.140116 type:complete len:317 (-) Transcript_47434:107-1057(-)
MPSPPKTLPRLRAAAHAEGLPCSPGLSPAHHLRIHKHVVDGGDSLLALLRLVVTRSPAVRVGVELLELLRLHVVLHDGRLAEERQRPVGPYIGHVDDAQPLGRQCGERDADRHVDHAEEGERRRALHEPLDEIARDDKAAAGRKRRVALVWPLVVRHVRLGLRVAQRLGAPPLAPVPDVPGVQPVDARARRPRVVGIRGRGAAQPLQQLLEPDEGVVVGVHPVAKVETSDRPAPRGHHLWEERLVALWRWDLQQVAVLRLLRLERRHLVWLGRAEEEAIPDPHAIVVGERVVGRARPQEREEGRAERLASALVPGG